MKLAALHLSSSGGHTAALGGLRECSAKGRATSPWVAAPMRPGSLDSSLKAKLLEEPGQTQTQPDLKEVVIQRSAALSSLPSLPLPLDAPAPRPPRWARVPGLGRLVRVVSETFLVARLAVRLAGYVGFGSRWICSFLQLLAYAALLMPGFLQMVAFYYLSPRVRRGLRYGPQSRNVLDVFLPPASCQAAAGATGAADGKVLRPVVVYVTGGAWTIGYKAWGALLSRRLSEAGVVVCCLDYRNFPQGTALDMLEDINHGMRWVFDNIAALGGDPERVHVCGQSCGGHLASLALLTQAEQLGLGVALPGGSPSWDPSRVRAFVGVSGVYSVADNVVDHFDQRGLYKSLFLRIMSIHGEPQLKLLSPVYLVAHALGQTAKRRLRLRRLRQRRPEKHVPGLPPCDSASSVPAGGPLTGLDGGGSSSSSSSSSSEEEGDAEDGAVAHGEEAMGLSGHHHNQQQKQQHQKGPGERLPHAQSAAGLYAGGSGERGTRGSGSPASGSPASGLAAGDPAAAAAAAEKEEPDINLIGAAWGDTAGVPAVAAKGGGRSPAELMPQVLLLHGDADRCAPVQGAQQFAQVLRGAGVPVRLRVYRGGTHCSPLLEDPMRGGKDDLTDDILSLVWQRPSSHSYPTLCPGFLISLATRVCPF